VPQAEVAGYRKEHPDRETDQAARRALRDVAHLPARAERPAVQPPPFGTLSAVDVRTGKIRWEVPLGQLPVPGRAARSGARSTSAGPLATGGGLVFIGASVDPGDRPSTRRRRAALEGHAAGERALGADVVRGAERQAVRGDRRPAATNRASARSTTPSCVSPALGRPSAELLT
jgi:hypothetical protein